MGFNQTGDISTLGGSSLKLVDKFTNLGSYASSTEKNIDTRLTKAWTAIDKLSVIWKSDLTDKMKRSFFQAAIVSILLYGCTTWILTKRLEKKLDGNYTRIREQYWTNPGGNTPQSTNYTATYLSSRKLSTLDEPDMRDTAGEAETNQKWCTIGRRGEIGSEISVLAARHDDDDDIKIYFEMVMEINLFRVLMFLEDLQAVFVFMFPWEYCKINRVQKYDQDIICEIDIFIQIQKTFRNVYNHRNLKTLEIGSGTKLFITFLSLRFFNMRRERHNFFLCWLFHLTPTTCGETKNRLPSFRLESQLTVFFF